MTKKGVFENPNTKLLLLVSCNMYSSVHMLQPAVSHASFEIIREVIPFLIVLKRTKEFNEMVWDQIVYEMLNSI